MKLTDERVQELLLDCLFSNEEAEGAAREEIMASDRCIRAEGITAIFGFQKAKIEAHRMEIAELLAELPDEFSNGGGWSFLKLCMRRDGVQWTGLHRTAEALMAMGIAAGFVEYLVPRFLWLALPGGMPYVHVKTVTVTPIAGSEAHV